MIFNVRAVNQDEHVKNLSFQMSGEGRWRLSRAYDLTHARGAGFTASHQMRIRDRWSGFILADIVAVGREFGVRDPEGIIRSVAQAVATFPEHAQELGVPDDFRALVQGELEARRRDMGL